MVNFEDGILVTGAYVEINGVQYPVHMPEYSGNTPVTSENLNKLQNDLQEDINDINNVLNKCTQIFNGRVYTGGSTEVSEAITNFRMLYVRLGASATYIPIPVLPRKHCT